MRTIPLETHAINGFTASSLAYEFNRRLNHIGNPLVNVTINVDRYAIGRDFATKTYDWLTITAGDRWSLLFTFKPDNSPNPVTVDLTRLINEGGIYHTMAVNSLDPNTIISASYIKERLRSEQVATLDRYNGWMVTTMVVKAYASAIASHVIGMTVPFTIPNKGDASISLVTAGRTPDNMNQYFITVQHRPDGTLAVDTRCRFYGNRLGDDLENIIYYLHYQKANSLEVLNTWLPISMFIKDLYFQVNDISRAYHEVTTDYLSAYEVPQLYGEHVLRSPRFFSHITEDLKRTYFRKDSLTRLFGYEFEKCAITGKFFAKPGADPDIYETLYSISDFQTLLPVSTYALRKNVARLIVDEECDDCGTFVQVSRNEFYRAVQERFTHVFGHLADFVQSGTIYFYYEVENPTDDENVKRMYRELYSIADSEYPDYAPDYYCDSCGRGEDYYDDYEDNDHRNEYLGSSQIDKLNEIATGAGLTIVSKEGFQFFTDNETQFNTDFQWRNFNNYEIHDYSYRPGLTFVNGDCMDKTKLYMGVEWEMDNGGEIHRKAVAINSALSGNQPYSWTMTDGSLHNGIEIATMPATLDAHTNVFNWDLACKTAVALGYRAHDTSTAGIHVHINRNFFSDDKKLQLYRASLMALVMERNWDDFVKFSRRRYNRLDQWAKKKKLADNIHPNITTEGMVNRVNAEYGNGDKYLAINLRNTNTFELRIFRGTLKADSIKATLQFVSNLANFCKYNNLAKAQTATFEDIINYKEYPELKAYWEENKNREVND